MKQEGEISQLKETTRLEREEREEQWERKQKLYEFEINQFEEKAKLASTEIEKLRKDNEQLKKFREEERLKRSQEVEQHNDVGRVIAPQGGTLVVRDLIDITRRMKQQLGQTLIMETKEVTETTIQEETNRHADTTEIKCTETREIEGELDGVKDEHTHMEVVEDHEGELGECLETRCKQLDSLLQERRETLCSLEADRNQESSV